jgi:CMP/dCMP kinase
VYTKITISGKICTGKSSVFLALQKKLQWPTFSTGAYFREYAKTHHLQLNKAEEQSDSLTREIDSKVRDMLGKPGFLLVDSWLAGIMAEGIPNVLKILLITPDEIRFERFAKREKVSFEIAKKEVDSRDLNWFEKVRKIHNRSDFFNEKNYDVIINSAHLSIDQVVEKILSKLITSHQSIATV